MTERPYYFPPGSPDIANGEGRLLPFTIFQGSIGSLHQRNARLKLNRLSLIADIIKERAKRPDLTFEDLMQADFVLFLRSDLLPSQGDLPSFSWFPNTLVYTTPFGHPPFEIFMRSQSSKYFERIKIALGIQKKQQLFTLMEAYKSEQRRLPQWQFDTIDPGKLMNLEKLCTIP